MSGLDLQKIPASRPAAMARPSSRHWPIKVSSHSPREPLNNSARARRRLCGRLRLGLGERGLVIPNERAQTRRRPRRGPSRMGFAGKAASRALRPSAVATATVTRVAPHDLRLLRQKRAPCRVIQRFPRQISGSCTGFQLSPPQMPSMARRVPLPSLPARMNMAYGMASVLSSRS